jgi:hypothetical protein
VTGKERISPVLLNLSKNPQTSSASYINIKMEKYKGLAMIDSGAEVSVIDDSFAKETGHQIIEKRQNGTK